MLCNNCLRNKFRNYKKIAGINSQYNYARHLGEYCSMLMAITSRSLREKRSLLRKSFQTLKMSGHQNIIQVVGKEMKHVAFDGYKTEMVNERNKCDYNLVKEYMEQGERLDSQTGVL